ncbi:cystathionine gamma-synthase [Candidatus Woesebacteria bacterium GWB1_37_5]|nr:MAG: cystathionine gamma-synthase [Candidatus Woesebacteria bacterium GWB1_37_5]
MKYKTKLIHVGEEPNLKKGGSGDVVSPIHLASTFARKIVEIPTAGYEYSRTGNPTRTALEKRLAVLESAKYGLAFSSGLAATTTLLLTVIKTGDHVIASDDLYGGTKRLFNKVFKDRFAVTFNYVDMTKVSNVEKGIQKNTKLIWLESPTNPLLKLADIREVARIAKKKGILLVVDNTFMSPYFQQPLAQGADIVLHSTTKYINGHSDSIGGAIMLSKKQLYQELKFNQNAVGAILSPFDSFLTLRGIKTLALRMEVHQENTLKIARFLEIHPKVAKIYYPGLPSHPQHELAKRQMSGFGGIISFEIKGGLKSARSFLTKVKLFALAESLGGVESLIEHPALMTHASVPKKDRIAIGLTDGLIRVSVGIEDAQDLINDLKQALD